MNTYRVFRDCPPRQRQYLRRVVWKSVLWNADSALALRMDKREAERWALVLKQRSVGSKGQMATEPPGEYGTQEATL